MWAINHRDFYSQKDENVVVLLHQAHAGPMLTGKFDDTWQCVILILNKSRLRCLKYYKIMQIIDLLTELRMSNKH